MNFTAKTGVHKSGSLYGRRASFSHRKLTLQFIDHSVSCHLNESEMRSLAIELLGLVPCHVCLGLGRVDDYDHPSTCPECRGNGLGANQSNG